MVTTTTTTERAGLIVTNLLLQLNDRLNAEDENGKKCGLNRQHRWKLAGDMSKIRADRSAPVGPENCMEYRVEIKPVNNHIPPGTMVAVKINFKVDAVKSSHGYLFRVHADHFGIDREVAFKTDPFAGFDIVELNLAIKPIVDDIVEGLWRAPVHKSRAAMQREYEKHAATPVNW